ncbi:energy-coupling factor ABC transporter ATP-binding protein [Rhodobacter calidifons]|uniref:ABC transporter ATP-binding protein n=1 Tax=Rhodobacter calidifons TaxID=2715277 RepID=A0ABX0G9E4_9RHOB|nr:ABC transporter ATP-binding protein [Rhodobacter calidifons]NHB77542.1 ABC transporter ATP-binding protein [Rhodobacter calidifons]
MPDPSSGIEIASASVRLGDRAVLRGLNLRLTERRIGVLGRNGSGKTTLLRLIAGLIAPDSGTVRVDGFDPFADRRAAVAALGILFQNPDHQILFPTVEEELAFGLAQQGLPQARALARAREILQAEGRTHWASAPVSTLSQGQRHYLCLLSVLLMEPRTILLDEPLAGLDLPTQARLARRFAALPQRLVTITHDPASLQTCDRLLWLEAGQIVADGPPQTVIPAFTAEMARIGAQDADADLAG